jgi:hypothetical protein
MESRTQADPKVLGEYSALHTVQYVNEEVEFKAQL